jgi:hypothetical protein
MTTTSRTRRAVRARVACAAAAIAATVGACAAGSASTRDPAETASTSRGSANVLTTDEIRRANVTNVYDLVVTLRPRWTQTRGQDSFQSPTQIQVYIDNARLSAGINGLRDLPAAGVSRVEFVGAIEASARWGLDHGQGAIVVTTTTR